MREISEEVVRVSKDKVEEADSGILMLFPSLNFGSELATPKSKAAIARNLLVLLAIGQMRQNIICPCLLVTVLTVIISHNRCSLSCLIGYRDT